jgi:hypothetical protein
LRQAPKQILAAQGLKVGTFASAEIILDDTHSKSTRDAGLMTYQIPSNLVQAKPNANLNASGSSNNSDNADNSDLSYYIYVLENNKIAMKPITVLDKNSQNAIIQGADINQTTQLLNMPISIDQVGKSVFIL